MRPASARDSARGGRSRAGAGLAGDLANEERLLGGSEEECEDLASGLAEKEVSDGGGWCTHFEYNCTQNEYGVARGEAAELLGDFGVPEG